MNAAVETFLAMMAEEALGEVPPSCCGGGPSWVGIEGGQYSRGHANGCKVLTRLHDAAMRYCVSIDDYRTAAALLSSMVRG